jgi:hypothetical protein
MSLNASGVANVSEAQIAAQIVQDFLTDEAVLIPSVMNLSSQVRPGAKSVGIPKISGLAAADVKEDGTEQSAGGMAVDSDVLLLNQFREVPDYVYETGDLQSVVDLENAFFDAAPRVYAEDMESKLYTEMHSGASTSSPDHLLQMSGTSNTVPTLADIRLASELLDIQKVPQTDRFLIVTPTIKTALLSIDEIQHSDKSGVSSPNVTGQFAEIYGFKLLVSNQVTADTCMAYHKSAAAYAWQKTLRTIREVQESKARTFVSVRGFWGRKTLDTGKRIIAFNATGS